MKNPTHLHIAEPCHENWNSMSAGEHGRFCGSCCKVVTDFTNMSNKEILQILSEAAGNSCGRFTSDQLERPLYQELPVRSKPYKFFLSAILPTFLLANSCMAQKTVTTKKAKSGVENIIMGKPARNLERTPPDVTMGTPRLVEHTLGEVLIKDTSIQSIGQIKNDVAKPGTELAVNKDNIMMGGISYYEKITIADTVKTYVRKALNQNGFKILGNPAAAGSQVNLQFKNEGKYAVQLLDAAGKVVLVTNVAVPGKNGTARVLLPNNFIPGTYFVKATDTNKKCFTDKVNIY